ncbi:response regulator [Paenibacillus glycinis]|uniref:Response regulator n=1 Tax=Paenibacillus glycinis TaxID=2697035 RepID=A0ABW9XZ00_9BACL|nr:response regulator [Paenibacillus glycinis]NBD27958.1 response regulator [Paenibacillus glycinis]
MSERPIRLLVVDDEPLARMRIRSFGLAARGYEIAAEAENGEQAWRMLGERQPDIVIADIGMPVLDGLGLLERIRGMTAPPAVILLTCFEDFDKAQHAMRFGAADYLTKLLLSETEFIACLDRAVADMRKTRLRKRWTMRQLLQDRLLSGTATATGEELERETAAFRQFRLGALRFPVDAKLDAARLIGAYESEAAPYASFVIRLTETDWAVLLVSAELNGCADFNAWSAGVLRGGYEECAKVGLEPLQALSDARFRLDRLPAALLDCRWLLERAFYEPRGIVMSGDGQGAAAPDSAGGAGLRALHARIKQAAEELDAGAAFEHLRAWRDEIVLRAKPGAEQLRHAGFELGGCFREDLTMETDDGAASVREWIPDEVERCGHADELTALIERLIDRLKRGALPPSCRRQEIRDAIGYIRDHYREDIDAAAVARRVNLSPSWFATLFRNETGRSFLDFLQDYRLEQAREMMARSDLKIYEISTMVGIANPRYFSRLFSDKYRISPQDYRSKAKGTLYG